MSKTASEVAELRSKIKAEKSAAVTARAAADKLVESKKENGYDPLGTSETDRAAFEEIDTAYKVGDTHLENAAELERRLSRDLDNAAGESLADANGDIEKPTIAAALGMGALVVASDSYKEFIASGQLEMNAGSVNFDPVQVLDKQKAMQFLATGRVPYLAAAGDGDELIPVDENLSPMMIPRRAARLLEMINVSATGRDAVTRVDQTARTTAGTTTVPFGTALNESGYEFTKRTYPVYRKGHFTIVDEGNIADSDEFQSTVNGELVDDLRDIVEDDALNGPGGSDWIGIYNAGGIGTVDRTALSLSKADTLHRMITVVRLALEKDPTGFGINPEDFEEFYLEKDGEGRYLHHGGALDGSPRTIWGMPAMVGTQFGEPIVADWKRAATLWVRSGIAVAVDRMNAQFVEGLWTIRAQTRGAFGVRQPKAIAVAENY